MHLSSSVCSDSPQDSYDNEAPYWHLGAVGIRTKAREDLPIYLKQGKLMISVKPSLLVPFTGRSNLLWEDTASKRWIMLLFKIEGCRVISAA